MSCKQSNVVSRIEKEVPETKTLILGVGNPILSDDGAGIFVARALTKTLHDTDATILEISASGLDLLEYLVGFDRVIIIDAVQSEHSTPGQIHRFGIEAVQATAHLSTIHGVNLATALELGKRLGLKLPTSITIFGIEAKDVITFGETCTREVARAIPVCADAVRQELDAYAPALSIPGVE